ncbi:MAG: hypothetical protein JWP15_1324 [Alphaproteobacteria bacterium]|nr:hypothetical protein [Alphaproteobacteria bacterium]
MRNRLAALAAVFVLVSASSAAIAASDGKDRKVLVQNVSRQAIAQLFASPITATDWEEDLLGKDLIEAGSELTANVDNGTSQCLYDFKAVMADGKSWERRKVDVCQVAKWVIGDSGESLN